MSFALETGSDKHCADPSRRLRLRLDGAKATKGSRKMTRGPKTLGLCLLAALALSAVLAGSASARFESEAAETTVTRSANSTQTFAYQAEGIKVECKLIEGTGTIKGTASTEFEMATELKECSTILGPVDFEFNGCKYLFTAPKASTNLTLHILCPTGKRITTTVTDASKNSICTLHYGSQTPGGTITGSNVGTGTTREISIAMAMTGIVSERTGSALCGPVTSSTGVYSGSITWTGEKVGTKTHVGIFMD
jgi:hypothetical protein